MIQVVCNENIEEVLRNPEQYVDFREDKVLIRYYGEDTSNPTYIMIGQDEYDKFYLVIEDNDTSEDVYTSENESLEDLFNKLLQEIIQED
jgi:uncharacterized membrane protein